MSCKPTKFCLVLWKNTKCKTYSILPENRIRTIKKGIFEAKWRNKYYPARILQKSEDKKWLESLTVATDGTLSIEVSSIKNNAARMEERKKVVDMEKENDKNKRSVEEDLERELIQQSSIFENYGESSMCNMDTRLLSPSNNLDESDEDSSTEPPNFEINAEDFGSQQNLKKGSPTKPDNGPDSNAPSGSHFNDSFASQQDDEEVTIENIRFLEGILRWSKDTFKEQTGQDYDSITGQPSSSQVPVMEENPRNKVLGTYRIKGLGKVEIAPDTNIWMDKVELEFIKTEFRKNPKEMARKLMKNLLGENNLINMSPTGRGDHTAIPKQVLDNVESFVKENVKKGFKIKHQEYIRTLTLMCNTLRNQLKAKNKTGNDSNKGKQTKKKRGAKNNEKVDKEKQKNGKRKKASNEKDENSSATKDENQEEIENTRKKRKQDLTVIDENRNEEIKKKKKKKKKHEHEQEKGDENLKLSEETRNENDNVNFSKDSDEILKLKEGINKDQSKEGKKKRKKKRKQGNEEKEDEDSAKWTEESISGNEKENLNPSEETDEILEVKDGMGEDRDEESKKTNKKKKKQVNEEEE